MLPEQELGAPWMPARRPKSSPKTLTCPGDSERERATKRGKQGAIERASKRACVRARQRERASEIEIEIERLRPPETEIETDR